MSTKKNIGFLIGGTALAQIFTFAISPILTRLYTPESFGVLGTVLAASSIIAVFAHLRLNLAIAQGNNINEANIILKTSILFSVLLCLLSSIFLFISYIIFDNSYTLVIIAFIFFISLTNVLIDIFNYWQSYRNKHSLNARNSIARSLLTGGSQILLGFLTNFGLIFGVLIGGVGSLILFLKEYMGVDNKKNNSILSSKRLIFVLKKYKDFPLYSMPQGFIASASLNSVPIILGISFGIAFAGQYWLAYRILLAPIALIGGAYRQVLHPIFSNNKIKVEKKIRNARKHTGFFLIIIVPIITVFFLSSEKFFNVVFGSDWITAGKIASWLVLCFMLDIVKIPSICLAIGLNLQKEIMIFEVVLGICRLLGVLLSLYFSNPILSVKIFSIVSISFSLLLIFSILYKWVPKKIYMSND